MTSNKNTYEYVNEKKRRSCGVFTDVTSSETRSKARISCHSGSSPFIVCREYRAMNTKM